jgi:phosphoribosylformylglycinamidine cyclo-ligase
MAISYKDAGVDRDLGDLFVKNIGRMVRSTYNPAVRSGVGGFASLYKLSGGRYLAAGTDGVGTKLKLAQELGLHHTIGMDLVAMCVNDVICTGAKPLFFLDYFACGRLDLRLSEAVIKGIVSGCKEARMALVGGETAEMPGMYEAGVYDLAGFAVGEVHERELITGERLKEGDELIALASSGPHSNGYSLIRKLVPSSDLALAKKFLVPTKIYVHPILALLKSYRKNVKGLAHITGSGFLNIPRINGSFDYVIENRGRLSPLFKILQERSALADSELYSTFNMGVGFVVACKKGEAARFTSSLKRLGVPAWRLGHVVKGKGKVRFPEFTLE